MNLQEIIQTLRNEGHSIDAYKRKDGGYLIKSIDGIKFQGATGNKVARDMTGSTLTERKISQLKAITTAKGTKASKQRKAGYPKKTPLSDELKREIRKTQRIWRTTQAKGRITTEKIRNILETQGESAAYESLRKAQAYSRGIAYDKVIEALAQRIERVKIGHPSLENDLKDLAEKIRDFIGKNSFKDVWISKINNLFYLAEELKDDYEVLSAIEQTYIIISGD